MTKGENKCVRATADPSRSFPAHFTEAEAGMNEFARLLKRNKY